MIRITMHIVIQMIMAKAGYDDDDKGNDSDDSDDGDDLKNFFQLTPVFKIYSRNL